MNIASYILRRLILAILVLLGVVTITFILAHSLGGNPIDAWLGSTASLHPQLAKEFAEKFHLNQPLWVQYFYYIENLVHGNLGLSPSKGFEPVTTAIGQTLPLSLQIVFFTIIISLALGVLLGVVSARYHHRPIDNGITGFYLAGTSSPWFLTALLLLILFAYVFHLLPNGGAVNPLLSAPAVITGIPMLDALIGGNFAYFWSALVHVLLPSMALALGTFGYVVRVLRNSLLDVMRSYYIRTARAKGLNEETVLIKHGLRNAMISVVTLFSIIVTWSLTGTIFVEHVFSYPGMGQYVFTAVSGLDYPAILGTTLVFAIIIVTANLAADILYAVFDPQIRLG